MQLIEQITLSSAQSSITFSSIPATFTDLYLLVSARSSTTSDFYRIRPNGSTSNHTGRFLSGDGSSVSSGTSAPIFGRQSRSNMTANTFGSDSWYLPNYTAASAKSISVDVANENNATENALGINAGLWNDTSAITSIEFHPGAGDFVSGSSFTLYGILAGSDSITTVS
jgi:hypothetical protein